MCKFLTQLLVNIYRHLAPAPAPAPVHRHLATGEAVCEAGKMSLSICFWGCEPLPWHMSSFLRMPLSKSKPDCKLHFINQLKKVIKKLNVFFYILLFVCMCDIRWQFWAVALSSLLYYMGAKDFSHVVMLGSEWLYLMFNPHFYRS